MKVSVYIVSCLYAVRDLFVLERLNLFEFRRDGVIFVVVFAEEQYDRLASGNDGFCFGGVYVVVNGQNVDIRFCVESDGNGRKTLPFSAPLSAFQRLRVSLGMCSSSMVTPGETIETGSMVAVYIS